jgi:hypothetical protein
MSKTFHLYHLPAAPRLGVLYLIIENKACKVIVFAGGKVPFSPQYLKGTNQFNF